jgi:hypothetical protein
MCAVAVRGVIATVVVVMVRVAVMCVIHGGGLRQLYPRAHRDADCPRKRPIPGGVY